MRWREKNQKRPYYLEFIYSMEIVSMAYSEGLMNQKTDRNDAFSMVFRQFFTLKDKFNSLKHQKKLFYYIDIFQKMCI